MFYFVFPPLLERIILWPGEINWTQKTFSKRKKERLFHFFCVFQGPQLGFIRDSRVAFIGRISSYTSLFLPRLVITLMHYTPIWKSLKGRKHEIGSHHKCLCSKNTNKSCYKDKQLQTLWVSIKMLGTVTLRTYLVCTHSFALMIVWVSKGDMHVKPLQSQLCPLMRFHRT